MKKLPWKNIYFLIVLTLFGMIGLQYCIGLPAGSLEYTNSIWAFLLWAALLYSLRKLTTGDSWEQIRLYLNPCFVFGLCFTGAMAAGAQLDIAGAVDFADWRSYAAILTVAAMAAPFLARVLAGLSGTHKDEKVQPIPGRKKTFLVTWGVLFLAYIPTFLASYPGFFTYDAEWTAYVVFTEKYSAHVPPLYVVLLGWLLRIVFRITHSYNVGIALYIIMQMLVLSAIFAYVLSFLRSIGVRRLICILGTAFLALSPTVSMFICCSTKEVYFAGGVILLTTLLLEQARDEEQFWQSRQKKICFAAASLLILFFRKDGIYALTVFLVLFAISHRRSWKRWCVSVVSIILVYAVTTQGLMLAFNFKKGPLGEMFCVPMQQLARTYIEEKDSFTEKDLEILYSLIPEVILNNYNPKLADDVKINFMEDNFKADPGKYISLWLRTGGAHFDIYVNAFLMNTYGYWYPNTVPDGYRGKHTGEVVYGDSSYFAFSTENPGVRAHLLPVLERFYEKISLEIYQQKVPVFSMLFSIGFWHWIYLFAAMSLFVRGYRKQVFALIPIGLLYLIILLGPIVLVRYVLYLFFGVPLALALLFDAEKVAGPLKDRLSN